VHKKRGETMEKIRIFFLEDDEDYFGLLKTVFNFGNPGIELVLATDFLAYQTRVAEILEGSFNVLVFDGNIGAASGQSNTAPVVERLRKKGYKGIIVGLSNSDTSLEQLQSAGCDAVFNKIRNGIGVREKILALLSKKE
jgi:methylmalonyl-CoA mutase cobalamin-binding subunit